MNYVMRNTYLFIIGLLHFFVCPGGKVNAFDYPGHVLINQLALAAMPSNFPAFATASSAQQRIVFLAGEPDRWRNSTEASLRHVNGPDHYMDLEELETYGLTVDALPPLRYDFVAQLALARAAHPEKFPPIDPARNMDHTRELVGFLPWSIMESYSRLKSEFSYLRTYETAGGTPEEIANAQANVIYTMGVMGHFVGDAGQPLHTTIHFNGWTGQNPHHYTTNRSFHAWIDGGLIAKANIEADLALMKMKLHPARVINWNNQPAQGAEMFRAMVAFIQSQNKLVEPLYQLEQQHKLSGEGEQGLEGKAFIEGQLITAGQMLADIWYSAWQEAPMDTHLKRELDSRSSGSTGRESH